MYDLFRNNIYIYYSKKMIKKELLEIIKGLNLKLGESFTETKLNKNSRVLATCVKISEEV
jgi:hypothetical protein